MYIELCEVCTLVESTLANTLYTLADIDSLELTPIDILTTIPPFIVTIKVIKTEGF